MTLLSQLQDATEGSDELDALISAVCDNRSVRYDVQGDREYILGRSNEAPHDECVLAARHSDGAYPFRAYRPGVKCYTTNLQDAVSLIDHKRFDWLVGSGEAWIWPKGGYDPELRVSCWKNRTPCLALCIAIIKAHESSKAEAA